MGVEESEGEASHDGEGEEEEEEEAMRTDLGHLVLEPLELELELRRMWIWERRN